MLLYGSVEQTPGTGIAVAVPFSFGLWALGRAATSQVFAQYTTVVCSSREPPLPLLEPRVSSSPCDTDHSLALALFMPLHPGYSLYVKERRP